MGAWGVRAFDNDTAGDWADRFKYGAKLNHVTSALAAIDVVDDDAPLDPDGVCKALAACEVLARLRGNPGYQNPHTEAVDAWVAENPFQPPPQMLKLADRAIDRILDDRSKLRQYRKDEAADQEWRDAVEELRSRVIG